MSGRTSASITTSACWCRRSGAACRRNERDPAFLIREGYLEPLEDFEHEGRNQSSPAGSGIASPTRFVRTFFGRVFDNPAKVFDEAILKPETQDPDAFADGIKNITEAQQRVAREYI